MSTDLDVDKGPAVLTTVWALSSAACMFVAARLLVRVRILQKAGWDDWLITLSMAIGFTYAAIISVAVHAGYGKHTAALTPSDFTTAKIYNLAAFAPGLLAIVVPKLAVVTLLARTMNPSPRQKWFLWTTVVVSGLLLMGCVVILYAQCRPTRALWEPEPIGEKVTCWSPEILVNYSIVVGAIAAAVDAYLAIYPTVVIWKLHMSIKKKIGLSLALGLGAGACIMALIKCTRLPTLYHDDATYATVDLFIWTSIESNAIIIAACVPTIAPLVEMILGKRFFGSTDKYPSSTDRLAHIHGRARGESQPYSQDQAKAPSGRSRAKAWMSSINVERSYHQCSIQRGSDEDLHGLNPSPTLLALEEGYGTVLRDGMRGIQRRDDVIIEYGRWPETNSMVEGKD